MRCSCGTVRGVARDVAPSTVNHCFCYCDDCQAFAHFLGRADEILDAHGGTEITQMSQANVVFTAGADKIAAMRLAPKGIDALVRELLPHADRQHAWPRARCRSSA